MMRLARQIPWATVTLAVVLSLLVFEIFTYSGSGAWSGPR